MATEICRRCHGTGAEPEVRIRPGSCWRCGGTGTVTATHPVGELPVVAISIEPVRGDTGETMQHWADHFDTYYDIQTGEFGMPGEVML